MTPTAPDTEELLRRSQAGDRQARGALLQRHRQRLQRMVALRLDRRLAARLDPSDIVQEALAEADRRLDDYARERPVPFYPWLRQLAWERLAQAHRRHVQAGRRSVTREDAEPLGLPDGSALRLADRLLASGVGPSEALRREELRQRVRGNAAYARAFRDYGLDVEASGPAAGEWLRARSIAVQLAAALDDWATVRRHEKGEADVTSKHLLATARAADADPLRTWVRRALEAGDRAQLEAVADMVAGTELSASTLFAVGVALEGLGASARAVDVLREGQRRYPGDFWVNLQLAFLLKNGKPPQLEEAIRFYTVALALRPQSPGVYVNLGSALHAKGRLDEAIAEYREAIRLKQDFAGAHYNLGHALRDKGRLDEAIAAYRQALRLNKDYPKAHTNLGHVLHDKGDVDGAIAEYREALATKQDFPEAYIAHYNLGNALRAKGRLEEAEAADRKAIELKPDYAAAHGNLGLDLEEMGREDEAIAEYHEAIRLNKDDANAHYNLGHALAAKGRLDEAIAAYREALRLNKDLPEAHCNLGHILRDMGKFAQALAAYRRGHELGSKNPRWPYPSAQWLKDCERLVELDSKLPALLSGQEQPADAAERAEYAHLCQIKHLYAIAARLYREAITVQPALVAPPANVLRYNAACCAALAAAGQGQDADKLDAQERARWRKQALDWLRADLEAYRRLLDKEPDKARPVVAQKMRHWLRDPDFNGVRGPDALAQLPQAERAGWHKLWADVAALLRQDTQTAADYAKLIDVIPHDTGRWDFLWEAYFRSKQWDTALRHYAQAIEQKPERAFGWIGRGMTFAERGEWEKAAADFSKAAGLKDAPVYVQYYQALLRLRAGDADGYRDSCAGMLKRGGTSDSSTLWTCVLAPNAVGDPMALANGAEKAVGEEPKGHGEANLLGAALYRAGRYDEAARQLTRASGLDPGPYRTNMIYTWFFLAMAHHRLGHVPQARQWLDKAIQATDRALDPSATPAGSPARDASDPAGGIPPAWNRRLTLELLRREAVELLKVETAEPELAPLPQEVP
jgi:tetratricopeptide (TPR) repeat protein